MARPIDTAEQAEHDALPTGWDYNPSSWSQRVPILALALLAFAAALHLALYQWGRLEAPWEPFFGDGSRVLLDSRLARLLPVPAATLGAVAYLLTVLSAAIGGRARWRSMPWLVLLLGLLVTPLAALNVLLVILQPTVFGTWCTPCLFTALLSVLMVGPVLDEVLVSLQHLQRVARRGGSRWQALWGLSGRTRRWQPLMEH